MRVDVVSTISVARSRQEPIGRPLPDATSMRLADSRDALGYSEVFECGNHRESSLGGRIMHQEKTTSESKVSKLSKGLFRFVHEQANLDQI